MANANRVFSWHLWYPSLPNWIHVNPFTLSKFGSKNTTIDSLFICLLTSLCLMNCKTLGLHQVWISERVDYCRGFRFCSLWIQMSVSGCLHERECLSWLFLNEATVHVLSYPPFSKCGPYNYWELIGDQLVLIDAWRVGGKKQTKNYNHTLCGPFWFSLALGEMSQFYPN